MNEPTPPPRLKGLWRKGRREGREARRENEACEVDHCINKPPHPGLCSEVDGSGGGSCGGGEAGCGGGGGSWRC